MRRERIDRNARIAHARACHVPFLCYQNNRLLQALINHRMAHFGLHPDRGTPVSANARPSTCTSSA